MDEEIASEGGKRMRTDRAEGPRGSMRTVSLFTTSALSLPSVPHWWSEPRGKSNADVTASHHNQLRVRLRRALRAEERTRWS
jgi:hypothetical protein